MSQYTNICFTKNNWTQSDYDQIVAFCSESKQVKYAIVAKEVGESGTPHLQGYVELKIRKRLNQLTIFGHIEKRKGKAWQAADYCKKYDKAYWQIGTISAQGKRTDIDKFVESVKNGMSDIQLLTNHAPCFIKYPRALASVRSVVNKHQGLSYLQSQYDDVKLHSWQTNVLNLVVDQPDRKILWIYDKKGGKGKSWLARYLLINHNAFLSTGGKKSDIAYQYDSQPVVVFDFSRTVEDFVSYDILECFKNGVLTSNKYESQVKYFKPPKVIVFSNFKPKHDAFTSDRLHIFKPRMIL